ncbi:MAG TPA: sodium:solute symporter, partial [Bacteroidia bacterium]|nr:sodium:solute symporter [Bacteroidia bacterium]
MSATAILICLISYFAVLMLVSYITGRNSTNEGFFLANRKSPWYLIAFGMIGSSISGVTFVSVPGAVKAGGFTYYELVLGLVLGYWVIAWVLMPVYYKLQLTSIYTYLKTRFGNYGYKTGASYFLLSRIIGASFRIYVAVDVLQNCIFNQWNINFVVSASLIVILIWLYTRSGGMKTIIWTDALQTFFLLAALVGSIILISQAMHLHISDLAKTVTDSPYSKMFDWDYKSKYYFFKQFFSGVFIAIAMTGLDQDMMQKNLTCKTIGESQKNIFSFSIIYAAVVLVFLALGSLLYAYVELNHIAIPAKADDLYPMLATQGHFGTVVAFLFVMGITAASFASADSALTALTTSFCVDILDINRKEKDKQERTRKNVHALMAAVLILVIIIYRLINDPSIINVVYKVAGYTYG